LNNKIFNILKSWGISYEKIEKHLYKPNRRIHLTHEGDILLLEEPTDRINSAWSGLYSSLYETLPNGIVDYDTKISFENIQQNDDHVLVKSNEKEYKGKILIVADGVRSKFRAKLTKNENLSYRNQLNWRGLCSDEEVLSKFENFFPLYKDSIIIGKFFNE
jgi:2-polyprenyl-6-methoxyphenol hydroxylase-like FAD-dependent oxidoreductase